MHFSFEHAGATFVGERQGEGQPVIFLHCGVGDHRQWHAQVEHFGKNALAVAYTRRGFGDTSHDDRKFGHVDDLIALIDYLGADEAILVGNSMGGALAIDTALMHPDRVSKICIIGSAVTGDDGSWFDDNDNPDVVNEILKSYKEAQSKKDYETLLQISAHVWLDGPTSEAGRVSQEHRDLFAKMNKAIYAQTPPSQEIARSSAFDRLSEIQHDVLAICGKLDLPYMVALHRRFEAEFPNIKSHFVDDVAHLPALERSELINPLIDAFIFDD